MDVCLLSKCLTVPEFSVRSNTILKLCKFLFSVLMFPGLFIVFCWLITISWQYTVNWYHLLYSVWLFFDFYTYYFLSFLIVFMKWLSNDLDIKIAKWTCQNLFKLSWNCISISLDNSYLTDYIFSLIVLLG